MELRSFQISLLLAPRPSNAGRETGRRIFLIREHCAYCMNGTIRIYRLSICPVSCLYTDCPYCTEIVQTHRRHGQGCSPPPPASPHGDTMDGASLARRGNATDTGKATANASDRDDQPRHAPVYDTADGAMIAATGRSGGKEDRKRQDGEKSGEQSGAGTR